jgi:hypothetical protein
VGDINFNEQDCTAAFKKLGEMVGSGLGQTWKNLDIKGSPCDFGAFLGGALDEAE